MADSNNSTVKKPNAFMLASTRAGNALSDEPWLTADGTTSLRVDDDEILSHIAVVLSFTKRPDDEKRSGWPEELSFLVGMFVDPEKVERGPEATLRQIKAFAPLPSKSALVRILLYCWYTCLALEFDESTPVEELLEEMRRVAIDQGFVSASDISKSPGRPPRVFKQQNKRRLKRFVELQSRHPDLSPDQISIKVADLEKTRSNNENRNIQIEVRRFFQRQGLLPKSPPPKSRKSRKSR